MKYLLLSGRGDVSPEPGIDSSVFHNGIDLAQGHVCRRVFVVEYEGLFSSGSVDLPAYVLGSEVALTDEWVVGIGCGLAC